MLKKAWIFLGFFLVLFLFPTTQAWIETEWNKRRAVTITVKSQANAYNDYPFNITFDTIDEVNDGDLDINATTLRVANSTDHNISYLLLNPNTAFSRIWVNFTNSSATDTTYYIYYDNTTPVSSAYIPNVTEFNDMSGTTFDKDLTGTAVNNLPDWTETDPNTHHVNSSGILGSADGNHSIRFVESSDDDAYYTPPTAMTDLGKIEWWQKGAWYIMKVLDGASNPAIEMSTDPQGDFRYYDGAGLIETDLRLHEREVTFWQIMYRQGVDKYNLTITFENGTQALAVTDKGFEVDAGTPTNIKWWTAGAPNVGDYNYGNNFHIDNLIVRNNPLNDEPNVTIGSEESQGAGLIGTNITLWLNGTEANQSLVYGDVSNITAEINVSDLYLELYVDTLLVNNDTTTVENITDIGWFANTTYEIKASYGGNATHASSERIFYIKMSKATATLNLAFNGTEDNVNHTYPYAVNVTAWNNSMSSGSQDLMRNGTIVGNPEHILLGAGYHNYTTNFTHQNYTADPLSRFLDIAQAPSNLTLTASPAWSIPENSQVTINCSASFNTTLYKDGITVTSPYTATLTFGTYNFTCEMDDIGNYTPASSEQTLNVISGGFGCSDTTTFAFRKLVNTTPSVVIANFTDLVNNSYVLDNLGDVYLNETNISTQIKIAGGSYYIVIHTENITGNKYLEFGNYITNRSYSTFSDTISAVNYTLSTYEEQNDYFVLNFYNEKTGSYILPPSANTTISLFCSGGSTSFGLNKTRILVASFEDLDDLKATVTYSSTEIYYRNLKVRADIEHKNFYLADANEHQVVEILFTLQDDTLDFGGSTLKVKKYLDGTLQTITELDFDAQNKAIVYLINGDKYSLYVDNGVEERNIGYLYVDSTDLEKTIVIGSITTTNMTQANITFALNMSGGIITFSWYDPANQTNQIELWVFNYSNPSHQLYYAQSTNRSRVNFNYVVPNASASYIVKYLVKHGVFGNSTTGLQTIFRGSYDIITAFPLTTLISQLGGSTTLWLTLLFIIPIPMLFTEKYVGIGAFVLVAVVALFVHWGLYAIPASIVGLGLFIAFMIYMKQQRRRT